VDWEGIDFGEVTRNLEAVEQECPDGSPQSRAVKIGVVAFIFLVGEAQRAWFLKHYQEDTPLTAYQRAHYEYMVAEEEHAAVETDAGRGDEATDLGEVLQRLNNLASQYPKGSPSSRAIDTIAEAVVSVSVDAVRARFIRFLQSRDDPMKEHQEKWHKIAKGEKNPTNGDSSP